MGFTKYFHRQTSPKRINTNILCVYVYVRIQCCPWVVTTTTCLLRKFSLLLGEGKRKTPRKLKKLGNALFEQWVVCMKEVRQYESSSCSSYTHSTISSKISSKITIVTRDSRYLAHLKSTWHCGFRRRSKSSWLDAMLRAVVSLIKYWEWKFLECFWSEHAAVILCCSFGDKLNSVTVGLLISDKRLLRWHQMW